MKPVSPRLARASHSSSSHCLCMPLSSCCLVQRNFCLACASCFVRFARALWRSFRMASASCAPAPPFSESWSGASSVVLTLPWPARSARPTSACFRAPTSLPPSPHMRAPRPCRCSSWMTAAFPCGVIRAYTRRPVSSVQSSGRASTTASSASPVARSTKDSASSAVRDARGFSSPRCSPVATTHRAPPSQAPSAVSSRPGLSPSAMPHVRATWRAVRGESPVSMATSWPDSRSAPTTSAESARARHSKETKPAKDRPHSTSSRGRSWWRDSCGRRRNASARTRRPLSARLV
mmetsp:Transcript_93187/g.272746  ORF Transcript_93187/g.272746 Transcript_93187/m.272746 type:complete len:292 (-) Transcript_93187:2268-3143(-)